MCPVDNQVIDLGAVFPDRFSEREILNLQCYCPFSKNGCQWKGLLRHLEVKLDISIANNSKVFCLVHYALCKAWFCTLLRV